MKTFVPALCLFQYSQHPGANQVLEWQKGRRFTSRIHHVPSLSTMSDRVATSCSSALDPFQDSASAPHSDPAKARTDTYRYVQGAQFSEEAWVRFAVNIPLPARRGAQRIFRSAEAQRMERGAMAVRRRARSERSERASQRTTHTGQRRLVTDGYERVQIKMLFEIPACT